MTRDAPVSGTTREAWTHDHCAVEWWFLHGHYGAPGESARAFMLAYFRYTSTSAGGDHPAHAHQLITSVLDPGESTHRTTTRIDPLARHFACAKLRELPSPIAPVMRHALLEELESRGPLPPVTESTEPVVTSAEPPALGWGDFTLRPDHGNMQLAFREPGPAGALVRLHLSAQQPPVAVPCHAGMTYHSTPRLECTGQCDGRNITGHAWFDHQWGTTAWLIRPDDDAPCGWDWFGINLDDGSDWIIARHHAIRSGEIIASHATCRTPDGQTRVTTAVALTPLREWQSPATRARYPVEWQIELPELHATLTFQPTIDNQEIATFGSQRAVWEGTGTITGRVAGADVRGRARGEFHGHAFLFEPDDYFQPLRQRITACLEEFLPRQFCLANVERFVGPAVWRHEPEAYTESLARPLWDLLDRNGKCWRPIFGILLLEAFGVPAAPYESLVSVMTELIHTAALIVDDIEDGATLRRGQECIHHRYGIDVALNAANLLFFLPTVALMEHPLLSESKRARLHQVKERVCIEAHCGQTADVHWSRNLTPERLAAWLADDLETKILQMYAFKTGADLVWLAEFAAVVADQGPEILAAASEFGRNFAVAFQIIDDVHDFCGTGRWTKAPGEDLANGKPTHVIARALGKLAPADATRLAEILCSPALRQDQVTRNQAIQLVRSSGVLEECRESARQRARDSWTKFARHLPPSEPKVLLHAMCLQLLDLDFDA